MGLLDAIFERGAGRTALIESEISISYRELAERAERVATYLTACGVQPGSVVALDGDGRVRSVVALLAVLRAGAIAVPIAATSGDSRRSLLAHAQVEWELRFEIGRRSRDAVGRPDLRATGVAADHRHYSDLRDRQVAGLVLFTSGSTGRSKGVVHDLSRLLAKFEVPGKDLRTLLFFHLDHISGIDTLFYALSNGSLVVLPPDRSVGAVCRAIADHRVEVLPTSPSFLHLMLLSLPARGSTSNDGLESLRCITYGGEVMPESTLRRLTSRFPDVRLSQKYGSTEFGTVPARPESSASLWMTMGGRWADTRVVEGVLQVRSTSAMLGYLDGEDPFTEDGWLDTRDVVEELGGSVRILGRESDVINVGGEKVHPARIESVVLELDEVLDAVAYGESNAILGEVVAVRIALRGGGLARSELRRLVQSHCRERLAPHEIPVRIVSEPARAIGRRFKRDRRWADVG